MTRRRGRLKILLSEGSSVSARQTLFGLGRRHHIELVDPNPLCQCRFSSLVRRWHRCPVMGKDPAGYIRCVKELLERRRYDVLFPTHDQIYLLTRFRDLLSPRTAIVGPHFDALRQMQSKTQFLRLAEAVDLPVPATRVARSEGELLAECRYPCFVKAAHGTASLGVRLVNSDEELKAALAFFEQVGLWAEGGEVVAQQVAPGCQCVVTVAFQRGRLVAAHCGQILETGIGGGPNHQISVDHPEVVEHMRRLGSHLRWDGPLVLEYFYADHTGPLYIEGNPRIGETVNARLAGIDFCELSVRIALGEEIRPQPKPRIGVRTHNGFINLLADAYNGAGRRQLLRRMWQSWTGKGLYNGSQSELVRLRDDWASIIPAAATSALLLAIPSAAQNLSRGTIANYSLPESAAAAIDQLYANENLHAA